jgi:3-hydroxyisobutyrate dehydrogenase-like beta-hydroxyacid dehydrogenase
MTAPDSPVPVTVVGLGAMGRAVAGAFLRAGHPVTVWNRSPGRAGELVAAGATEAPELAAAVAASPLVVVSLLDQRVSGEVLRPVAAELAGRTLVDLTSDTPERAREAGEWAAAAGIAYLDGAIMVPVDVVGSPEAMVLYSGPADVFAAARPALAALGGDARHLGEDLGLAALYDLAMLGFFYSAMAGLVSGFALVGSEGVRAADFVPFAEGIVSILPAIAAGTAAEVDSGDYAVSTGNVVMEAAGVGHVVAAARARGLDTGVIGAVKDLLDRAIAAGHGAHEFSSVVEVVRKPAA